LKAWNTGHPGGLATIHANSAEEALTRLEDLIGEVTQRVPYRASAGGAGRPTPAASERPQAGRPQGPLTSRMRARVAVADRTPGELMRAQSHLVAFLASLLQRRGVLKVEEFTQLLQVFADAVGETDPGEGDILAYWASAARDMVPTDRPVGEAVISTLRSVGFLQGADYAEV
jgi:hypothetical protein